MRHLDPSLIVREAPLKFGPEFQGDDIFASTIYLIQDECFKGGLPNFAPQISFPSFWPLISITFS